MKPRQRFLFSLKIAGVQEFIDTARTTEDFWASSYIISHLSEHAARTVQSPPYRGSLIFPATEVVDAVAADRWAGRCPNGLLAVVESGDPAALGAAGEAAVEGAWRTIASSVEDRWKSAGLLHGAAATIWNRQIGRRNFEVYWGAVEWADGAAYAGAYHAISQLLEARKTLRTFEATIEPGLKCSQCGKLQALQTHSGFSPSESRDYWERAAETGRQLTHRFRAGERLCAVCVVCRLAKRVYFEPGEGFPSTSSIAIAPFRRQLLAHPTVAEQADSFADTLRQRLGQSVVGPADPKTIDGDWFFEGTYDKRRIQREYGVEDGPDREVAWAAFLLLQEAWKNAKIDSPGAYLALVTADGDHVGDRIQQAVAKQSDTSNHRTLSQHISRIASAVQPCIDACLGRMVYSGGDDLLALLPAGTVADALDQMIIAVRNREVMGPDFSMSASVLVFPHTDSLSGAIREGARLMRSEAKTRFGRGCVVITARRQSGQQTVAALPWKSGADRPVRAFGEFVAALAAKAQAPSSISKRFIGQFAEIEPGLREVEALRTQEMAQRLLSRHSSAPEESVARQAHHEAFRILLDASYEMARLAGRPGTSVLLDTLLTARFLSRLTSEA